MLEGIDLELEPGSRTVVVGGNGSGKSTLLRIAAGVSRPSNGTVNLPDRIGYVPERLAARTRFTGAEYLSHMGRIKKLDARTVVVRSQELLERLDLQPGPDVPLASLSKGNCQKLVIAQAFLGPTDLLALDEPFSGLDPVAHAVLGELTTDAQAGGTIVLISSHFALPDQAAQLQLAIRNAGLVEIDSDEVPRGPTVDVMEVELLPTERASGREEVASIPGVSQARFVPPEGLLVLLTDRHHIDHVLTAAISQGWSVRSVRARLRDGSLE